ncbi:hypothetical protein KSF_001840 [Reticulibacter mediterranei]|uniref:TIR domain-containing protein n=1 Tax=Reticulibacter mediterranei TaxID=2778369 RepID=A0A8J3IH19_9CHLR|nr:toll/interleukin-1 receptor domain-containing protein [Reticulibacter mediterranei]GHO90136.1 hypothetical protein KSF_001840 [Reticulibacter mediterranei]
MATEEQMPATKARTDFFISYANQDHDWAAWIAWHLEAQGYTTILQAWDSHAGRNVVLEMDRATKQAERTIAVLSPEYLSSKVTPAEWTTAFTRDPSGERGTLLPIHVQPCDVEGVLGQMVFVDLVGRTEQEALDVLLASVHQQHGKPLRAPAFSSHSSRPKPDYFPGAPPSHSNRRSVKRNRSQRTAHQSNPDWDRMLRRLRRSYQELLDQSLRGITWIELGLSTRPDLVRNVSTSNLLFRLPAGGERLLAPGTSLLSVYDEAEEELLILGAPGVGKSTLLLDLAVQLVDRASVDPAHPLPVILRLSSWAVSQPTIAEYAQSCPQTSFCCASSLHSSTSQKRVNSRGGDPPSQKEREATSGLLAGICITFIYIFFLVTYREKRNVMKI